MRDWDQIEITPAFSKGFSPSRHDRLSAEYLSLVVNHKVTSFGLQAPDIPTPLSEHASIPALANPLPTVMLGEVVNFLLMYEAVYSLTLTSGEWVASAYDTYPVGSDTPDTIVRDEEEDADVYHTAEMGHSWFATDGHLYLFRANGYVYFTQEKVANTLCQFRGRIYLGGLAGNTTYANSGFWNEEFRDAILACVNPDTGYDTVPAEFGQNVVYYSAVGAQDLVDHYLSSPTVASLRHYTKRMESGFVAMPWGGTVLCVKPLGNGVMVYGTDGVSYLTHETNPMGVRITTTRLTGIPSRNSVAGDRSTHVFIGNDGGMWRIDESLKITELGYHQALLQTEDLSALRGLYDSVYGDAYFTSIDGTYLLSPSGLSVLTRTFISLLRDRGTLAGFSEETEEPVAIFSTGVLHFPKGSYGTLHGLRLVTKNPSAHILTVSHRKNQEEAWTEISGLTLDKSGFCDFLVTTYEFMITCWTAISAENTAIEGGTIFFDRTTRGLKEIAP